MSQGSFSPKIRFLGQKVCSVARSQTDRQTDTKVNTEDTLSGFQDFSNFPSTYHQGAVQQESLNHSRTRYICLVTSCSRVIPVLPIYKNRIETAPIRVAVFVAFRQMGHFLSLFRCCSTRFFCICRFVAFCRFCENVVAFGQNMGILSLFEVFTNHDLF